MSGDCPCDRAGRAITLPQLAGSSPRDTEERWVVFLRQTIASAPKPPSVALALAEIPRASLEMSSLLLSAPFLANAPRGDGHDVIVSPGFAFSMTSTILLRSYLRSLGYRVHDWGLGRNLGLRSTGETGDRLAEQIDRIGEGGRRKVSLVGHSLGGVLSRHYALLNPGRVRQVICIGSPFVGDPRAVNQVVLKMHDTLSTVRAGPPSDRPPGRLRVPFTAIYSRSDGIVSPSDCTDTAGPRVENIEVCSSHVGLISHPAVFHAVANRLAQPPDRWTAFRATGWRRAFYGSPPSQGEADDLAA